MVLVGSGWRFYKSTLGMVGVRRRRDGRKIGDVFVIFVVG